MQIVIWLKVLNLSVLDAFWTFKKLSLNSFFALPACIKNIDNIKITQKRFFSFIIHYEFHRQNYIVSWTIKFNANPFVSLISQWNQQKTYVFFMWKEPAAWNRLLMANFVTFWSYFECNHAWFNVIFLHL